MKTDKEKNKHISKLGLKKTNGIHNIISQPAPPNGYLLFILFTLLVTTILLWNLPKTRLPSYKVGDICRRDIKSPAELIVIDKEQTELRRQQAEKNVLPVFDFDTDSLNQQIQKIQTVFQKWRELVRENDMLKQTMDNQGNQKVSTGAADPLNVPKKTNTENLSFNSMLKKFIEEIGFNISADTFRILLKRKMDKEIENVLLHTFNLVYSKGIVSSRSDFLKEASRGFVRRNLSSGQEIILHSTDSILDIQSVKKFIKDNLDQLTRGEKDYAFVMQDFIMESLKPNLTLNKLEIQARKKALRNSVKNVILQAKPGEIIIREGDRIEDTHLLFLNEIGNKQKTGNQLFVYSGTFIILSIIGIAYFKYIKNFRPAIYADRKNLYLIASISLLILLSSRIFLVLSKILSNYFDFAPFNYIDFYLAAIPFASGSLLIALLVDTPSALMYIIYQSVATGIMTGGDFNSVIVSLVGSVSAVLAIIRHKRRTDIIRAGLTVCFANILIVFGLNLTRNSYFTMAIPFEMFCGFVGGVLIVLIVSTLMPVFESLFRITTDIRLAELSTFDHPFIKQMILNAPGTHQHSILVGSLAEAAAEAIGANALLARVASYFHDIGKIRKPYYFVENVGNKMKNQHSKLSPNLSGLVIVSHVKEGVEMAKNAKLGKPIIDIIKEHHGTKVIHYFYQKALQKEQNSNEVPSLEKFRYPGPKPSSKEAAIVLMADQVEAASRTLLTPTHAKIKSLVKKIINDNLIDEQLENCDLTLQDISKISDCFIRVLTAMFHHRIDYPGIKFDDDEKLGNIRFIQSQQGNKSKNSHETLGSP